MMTESQIRETIIARLESVNGACNQCLMDHTDGVMRGLLWALNDSDPGVYLTRDIDRLLTLAGIEHWRKGDEVFYARERR